MKHQLTILVTSGLLAASAVFLPPAPAQEATEPSANFYCGQSYDPTSKTNVPTTLVAISGRSEPLALITWKSEYFAEYTPQVRCDKISPKFQAAYTGGKMNYLVTGTHRKTGQAIICGIGVDTETCENDTNLLFTLKPYSNGKLVLGQLMGILTGDSNNPIYQSSGGTEKIDMRALLKARK